MEIRSQIFGAASVFSEAEKRGVCRTIGHVRRQFLPESVADTLIRKLLDAAHHVGSVRFMQPWSFVVIRSKAVKEQIKRAFEDANQRAATTKREIYHG
jgi:5,6-dimethylbenzimidazole synthase